MKQKLLRLLALALCLALLVGCGTQETAAGTPESDAQPAQNEAGSVAVGPEEPQEPEDPPYAGPLYEMTVEELPEPYDTSIPFQEYMGILNYDGEEYYHYFQRERPRNESSNGCSLYFGWHDGGVSPVRCT